MTTDPCQSDCRTLAIRWRERAERTSHAGLRESYQQIAASYEKLATQALLCRRLVLTNAIRRGEPLPCQCNAEAAADAGEAAGFLGEVCDGTAVAGRLPAAQGLGQPLRA